jgi:hypothetical protein
MLPCIIFRVSLSICGHSTFSGDFKKSPWGRPELRPDGNMAFYSIDLHIKILKGMVLGHALLMELNYYHTLK